MKTAKLTSALIAILLCCSSVLAAEKALNLVRIEPPLPESETDLNTVHTAFFNDGSIYVGSLNRYNGEIFLYRGVYEFVTGETATLYTDDTDNADSISCLGTPIKTPREMLEYGIITFADGEMRCHWWLMDLDRYRELEPEIDELYEKSKTPTAFRDSVIAFYEKKHIGGADISGVLKPGKQGVFYNELNRIAKQVIAELPENLRTPEQRLKNMYKLINEPQRENKLGEQKEENAQKRKLIAKYGQKYGEAIFERKLLLGMSPEIVNEELYPKDMFDIRKKISTGNDVEVWTLSERKLSEVMLKTGNAGQMNELNAIYGLLTGSSIRLTDLAKRMGVPSKMTFKNGHLVEVIY